jgi:hypothetical protein
MPTIAQLSDKIAAYIDRAGAALVTAGSAQDLILSAINDARRAAQRDHNFKMLHGKAFISIDQNGTDYLTGCKTTPGGATPQLMKTINKVWNYSTSVVGANTYYTKTSSLTFDASGSQSRDYPVTSAVGESLSASTSARQFAYLEGTTLCYNGATTASTFMVDGIKWAGDLTGSETTDIFINFFSDWVMWTALMSLNVFVKDDQRVTISGQLLSRAWDSVREMDGNIANSGDWTSLD